MQTNNFSKINSNYITKYDTSSLDPCVIMSMESDGKPYD
jgi:hypothetical protein